ncbi:MAG: ABC transporter substrate-binding protein, partial [Polyangiaceae bacterium]
MIPRSPSSSGASRRSFLKQLALLGAGGAAACAKAPPPTAESSAAAAPAAPTAGAAPPAAAAGQNALRVGYLPITDATPLLVAHGRGLFEAEGLQAERPTLLRSWPQVAEAFQARQVDVVHLLMPMTIWLRFGQNFPLKVVAWDHVDGSALTVASSVSKLTDLAGKNVAVPFW